MRLPVLKPKHVAKALKKAGFVKIRQTGSHLILANKNTRNIVTVPLHAKEMKKGLLFGIIKQSGLTAEEFIKLI